MYGQLHAAGICPWGMPRSRAQIAVHGQETLEFVRKKAGSVCTEAFGPPPAERKRAQFPIQNVWRTAVRGQCPWNVSTGDMGPNRELDARNARSGANRRRLACVEALDRGGRKRAHFPFSHSKCMGSCSPLTMSVGSLQERYGAKLQFSSDQPSRWCRKGHRFACVEAYNLSRAGRKGDHFPIHFVWEIAGRGRCSWGMKSVTPKLHAVRCVKTFWGNFC